MGIPKDKFIQVFQQLPEKYQENVLDFMEYLLHKAAKTYWDNIPEVDEPLNDEEKKHLEKKKSILPVRRLNVNSIYKLIYHKKVLKFIEKQLSEIQERIALSLHGLLSIPPEGDI